MQISKIIVIPKNEDLNLTMLELNLPPSFTIYWSAKPLSVASLFVARQFSSAELVGVPGIEPGTSALSGLRSNQLSYTPDFTLTLPVGQLAKS